jgi:hypothetical protein
MESLLESYYYVLHTLLPTDLLPEVLFIQCILTYLRTEILKTVSKIFKKKIKQCVRGQVLRQHFECFRKCSDIFF